MLGFAPHEIPGTYEAWSALNHPDDRVIGLRLLAEHAAGRLPLIDLRYRMRHKTKGWVWIHCKAKIVERDPHTNAPTRLVGAIRDISKEQALEDELSRLALIVRSTFNGVILMDTHFRIEWVNEAFQRMSGYTLEEVRGRSALELIRGPKGDRTMEKRILEALERGIAHTAEAYGYGKNQRAIYCFFEVRPIYNDVGVLQGYMAIAQDISKRRRAEQALKESETRFRTLADTTPVFIWMTDAQGQCSYVNQTWLDYTGRKLEEELGQGWVETVHPDDRRCISEGLEKAFRERSKLEGDYRIRRHDGIYRWFRGMGVARYMEGEFAGMIGSVMDITERVMAEQERSKLEERMMISQRLEGVGRLAGGIAHDFNNLLMGVLLEAGEAKADLPVGSVAAEALSTIEASAKRMAELVDQLLIYAGRGRFVVERVNPNGVVREMLQLLARNMAKQAVLKTQICADETWIEIDPSQLRQVVMNLVINASDALEAKGGVIEVKTRREGGVWVMEVRDTGRGMSEEVQRRVFDPFFTTKQTGRGLGLSTVHGIVQRGKGEIELASKEGEGTAFCVRFPVVDDSAVAGKQKAKEQEGKEKT